jgi:hypothetical protein
MKRIAGYTLALSLVAATPAVMVAQAGGPGNAEPRQEQTRQNRGQPPNPLGMLLERREDLALTDTQVTRLEAIETALAARLAPLQEQMRQLRPEQGASRGQNREAMQPLMEQMRQAHQEAMEQAQAVLTAEQRERVRSLRPAGSRGEMGPGMGRRGPGGGPGRP